VRDHPHKEVNKPKYQKSAHNDKHVEMKVGCSPKAERSEFAVDGVRGRLVHFGMRGCASFCGKAWDV
jgi:hypothetical protein